MALEVIVDIINAGNEILPEFNIRYITAKKVNILCRGGIHVHTKRNKLP